MEGPKGRPRDAHPAGTWRTSTHALARAVQLLENDMCDLGAVLLKVVILSQRLRSLKSVFVEAYQQQCNG